MNCHTPRPPAPPVPFPSRPLRAMFSRCPYCRGTTTLSSLPGPGARCLISVCYSCCSTWDLKGNAITKCNIITLPHVDGHLLTDGAYTDGTSAGRPARRAGRPPGSFDSKPRINTGRPRGTYKRRGVPSGAPADSQPNRRGVPSGAPASPLRHCEAAAAAAAICPIEIN